MYVQKSVFAVLCIGALSAASPASAQSFTDNFDTYTPGLLCPQGGWEQWHGDTDACGDVSTEQAHSGANSLKIVGNPGGSAGEGNDTVHRFTGATSGTWQFSVQTFVPTGATIILLNTYDDPPNSPIGTYRWSLQVRVDADVQTVTAEGGGNESTLLVQNQWVEFRAVIDLANDSVDYFYNGTQFVTGRSWINGVSVGGMPRIEALDLYGNEPASSGTSGNYFDDVSLTQAGGCPCDWNHTDGLNSQDFFDFLSDFFANNADFNHSGATDSQDFFDFLTCFFAGCP
jgi:hypothetical protein